MDPATHAPRDCDHCRTECLTPADRLAWGDVQLCAVCAEVAVQRGERADEQGAAPKKHIYRNDIDYAPDGTAWSWAVVECECDRPWRHA